MRSYSREGQEQKYGERVISPLPKTSRPECSARNGLEEETHAKPKVRPATVIETRVLESATELLAASSEYVRHAKVARFSMLRPQP